MLLGLGIGFMCILIILVSLGVGPVGYAKIKAGEGSKSIIGLLYFVLDLQLFYLEFVTIYLGLDHFILVSNNL